MLITFEKLDEKYGEVVDKLKIIYENNLQEYIIKNGLNRQLDTRVIYPDKEFMEYINYKKIKIKYLVTNEKYKDILETYYKELEDELEYASIETLGTSLNYLREFYPDLLNSLKRIKIDTD